MSIDDRTELPGLIATGRLDLNNVGALVSEVLHGPGAGEDSGQVEDACAVHGYPSG